MTSASHDNPQPLHFIIHTPLDVVGEMPRAGTPHRNCVVAAQRFLPLLEGMGTVSEAGGAASIAALTQAALRRGELPLLLSFALPHLLPTEVPCPTLVFFGWAYNTIPTEIWGNDARNDWRTQLGRCAGAITHSRYALHATDAATGGNVAAVS